MWSLTRIKMRSTGWFELFLKSDCMVCFSFPFLLADKDAIYNTNKTLCERIIGRGHTTGMIL